MTGTANDTFIFGPVLGTTAPYAYTVCSVTRYGISSVPNSTASQGRVLQATGANWLQGQYNGYSGVAFYGQWIASFFQSNAASSWVVMCGQADGINPSSVYVGDAWQNLGNGNVGINAQTIKSIGINDPNSFNKSNSDWAIMELITWSRILTPAEITPVMQYLRWKSQTITTTTTTTTTTGTSTIKSGVAERRAIVIVLLLAISFVADYENTS